MENQQKKPKGPIRVEAVVPFIVVMGLLALYFALLFDGHLRKGLEWAGTQGNGAEVNIGSLKTSFLRGSLDISDIQITDRETPARNKVQIGAMNFGLLWDALLRAKFVVTDASITGIQVNTERKTPGRVLPPAKESGMGTLVIQKLKDQIGKTSLGDFAKFLEGFDPTQGLKNLDLSALKSAAKVQELQAQLGKKEAEWNATLNSLPGQKDFSDFQARLTSIQPGGSLAEVPGKIQKVQEVLREGEAKTATITKLGGQLTQDVGSFTKSVGQVDDLVAQDRKDLESKLKLPSIDPKDLAMQIFGGQFVEKLGTVQGYMATARQYMPEKKPDEKPVVLGERRKGRTYEFPITTGYPAFWLRHAKISSKGDNSLFGGEIEGKLLDVSSNQAVTGKPAVLTFKGNFPKQNLLGIEFEGVADHRTTEPVDRFKASVASFGVKDMALSSSESLNFGFNQALAKASLSGEFKGKGVALAIENTFHKIDYRISSQSKLFEQILRGVTQELQSVSFRASATGTWDDLSVNLESNLAHAIQSGLMKQLQARIAEARKKIDELIQGQVGKARAQLDERVNAVRTRVTGQVEERRKQALAFKSQADSRINEIKSKASGPQQKALDNVKKKLPRF